jgi:hypothetical protein
MLAGELGEEAKKEAEETVRKRALLEQKKLQLAHLEAELARRSALKREQRQCELNKWREARGDGSYGNGHA